MCKWLLVLVLGSFVLNSVNAQPATPEQIEKARDMMRQIQDGQTPAAPAPAAQPAKPPVAKPAPLPEPVNPPKVTPAPVPAETPTPEPSAEAKPITNDQEAKADPLMEEDADEETADVSEPAAPPQQPPVLTQTDTTPPQPVTAPATVAKSEPPPQAKPSTLARILFGKRAPDMFTISYVATAPKPGTAAVAKSAVPGTQPVVYAKATEDASVREVSTPAETPSDTGMTPDQEQRAKEILREKLDQ